jgi:Tat protein translocase TatC
MADAPDTEEGGPVKSFLEHLEDLRWTLIKCASVLGVCILICLLAGNHVVAILLRPLQQARIRYPGTNQVVSVFLGTNLLQTYPLDPVSEQLFNLDTNRTSPLFSAGDITGLRTFVAKLKTPASDDPLSQFLSTNLSSGTRNLLEHYQPGHWLLPPFRATDDPALRTALAGDLDHLLVTRPIYETGFADSLAARNKGLLNKIGGVFGHPAPDLAPTLAQLSQNPQGPDLLRLNQRLLLDAYPHELSKDHERFIALQVVPLPGSNGLTPLALQIDTNVDAADVAQRARTSVNAFGPAKAFLIGFHVAVYAGIAMSSPFILYFIGQFVLPALRIRERKYLYRGLAFAIPLFLCGVSFCYFILMPAALAASQMYSDWFGFGSNLWDAGDYISFVCKFMLGMGLGFELPVVVLVLVKIGLLSYSTLSKARPYMIVINLILGAVLTTPEVFTQVLMAVPLQLLFEISVWVAWYWERQERKRALQATGKVD